MRRASKTLAYFATSTSFPFPPEPLKLAVMLPVAFKPGPLSQLIAKSWKSVADNMKSSLESDEREIVEVAAGKNIVINEDQKAVAPHISYCVVLTCKNKDNQTLICHFTPIDSEGNVQRDNIRDFEEAVEKFCQESGFDHIPAFEIHKVFNTIGRKGLDLNCEFRKASYELFEQSLDNLKAKGVEFIVSDRRGVVAGLYDVKIDPRKIDSLTQEDPRLNPASIVQAAENGQLLGNKLHSLPIPPIHEI